MESRSFPWVLPGSGPGRAPTSRFEPTKDNVDNPWADVPFELSGDEPWLSTEAALADGDFANDLDPRTAVEITPLTPDSPPGKYSAQSADVRYLVEILDGEAPQIFSLPIDETQRKTARADAELRGATNFQFAVGKRTTIVWEPDKLLPPFTRTTTIETVEKLEL